MLKGKQRWTKVGQFNVLIILFYCVFDMCLNMWWPLGRSPIATFHVSALSPARNWPRLLSLGRGVHGSYLTHGIYMELKVLILFETLLEKAWSHRERKTFDCQIRPQAEQGRKWWASSESTGERQTFTNKHRFFPLPRQRLMLLACGSKKVLRSLS